MHDNVQVFPNGAIGGLRFSGGFLEKSFSFFHVLEIDPFEQHGKLGSRERYAGFSRRRKGQMKRSAFQPLIPDRETVIVPIEDFELVAILVEEDEEGRRERIDRQGAPDNADQTVEGFSNVDRFAVKQDGNVGRQGQHRSPSRE